MAKLTGKQRLFVTEYLKDRSIKQAAVRAGYSEKSSGVVGNKVLQHPEAKAIVNIHESRLRSKSGITAEWLLEQLKAVAEQDDVSSGTKVRAIELAMKHLGMLSENINLKTDGLNPEQRAERVAVLLERVRSRE